jgi:hypothetical protein
MDRNAGAQYEKPEVNLEQARMHTKIYLYKFSGLCSEAERCTDALFDLIVTEKKAPIESGSKRRRSRKKQKMIF